jgi:uncharacterized protein
MDTVRDGVLGEMTRRIVDRFQPERILLFGSRARGDFRPDSDYDLLVVLRKCANRRQLAVEVRSELADLPAGKDILVAELADFEEDASRCSLIVRSALREGEILYARE